MSDAAESKAPSLSLSALRALPGPRLALFALIGLFPVLLVPLGQLSAGAGVALAALLDVLLLALAGAEVRWLRKHIPSVSRQLPRRFLLGVESDVFLHVRSRAPRPVGLMVRDESPTHFDSETAELRATVPANGSRALVHRYTPSERGDHQFGAICLRVDGPLGFGSIQYRVPDSQTVKVYPDVLGSGRRKLAARVTDLRQIGVRSIRRFGRGGEFEQLREYVQGDPFRDLDWKATAKRQRPVTRVFQDERSQPIILAVDAGRMMAPLLDGRSKLDHAVAAALLLAYVALKKGDRVGVVVFEEGVQRFLPPQSGSGQYLKILETLYAVTAGAVPADFRTFLRFLQTRLPRRSLVIVLTDLLDPTQSEELRSHAVLLKSRHLPVCVTMRDPITASELERLPEHRDDVFRKAAAIDLWLEQQQVKRELRKHAIQLVEAPASGLAVAAVNHYLEVKARSLL